MPLLISFLLFLLCLGGWKEVGGGGFVVIPKRGALVCGLLFLACLLFFFFFKYSSLFCFLFLLLLSFFFPFFSSFFISLSLHSFFFLPFLYAVRPNSFDLRRDFISFPFSGFSASFLYFFQHTKGRKNRKQEQSNVPVIEGKPKQTTTTRAQGEVFSSTPQQQLLHARSQRIF